MLYLRLRRGCFLLSRIREWRKIAQSMDPEISQKAIRGRKKGRVAGRISVTALADKAHVQKLRDGIIAANPAYVLYISACDGLPVRDHG